MRSKKIQHPSWKIGGMYFILTLSILTALSFIYNIFILRFGDDFPFYKYMIRNNVPFQIYHQIFSTLLFAISALIAAYFIKRKYPIKDIASVAMNAAIFSAIVEVLFFLRDFFIRDIQGIQVYRNYPLIIVFSILSVILYYFLSKRFLKK